MTEFGSVERLRDYMPQDGSSGTGYNLPNFSAQLSLYYLFRVMHQYNEI